jgi:hypothetical protein
MHSHQRHLGDRSLVGNLLNSFFVPKRFASGIKVVSGIATTGKEG